jgi:hypothetical protein
MTSRQPTLSLASASVSYWHADNHRTDGNRDVGPMTSTDDVALVTN